MRQYMYKSLYSIIANKYAYRTHSLTAASQAIASKAEYRTLLCSYHHTSLGIVTSRVAMMTMMVMMLAAVG